MLDLVIVSALFILAGSGPLTRIVRRALARKMGRDGDATPLKECA